MWKFLGALITLTAVVSMIFLTSSLNEPIDPYHRRQ